MGLKWFTIPAAIIGIVSHLGAVDRPVFDAVIASSNVAVHFPQGYDPEKRYPFLLVVEDPRQGIQSMATLWKPIAASRHCILVRVKPLPKESLSSSQLVKIRDYMDQHYKVDTSVSIMIGIGDSANLIVDVGLRYPRKVRNVIAFFASRLPSYDRDIRSNSRFEDYKFSEFVLVTAEGDASQNSVTHLYDTLQQIQIGSELIVYPDIILGYPEDLASLVVRISKKVAVNAAKEKKYNAIH